MTRLLRVVTLASATGMYGGPFDTARRQALIASELGFDVALLAGFRSGDRPIGAPSGAFSEVFVEVRPLLTKGKFFDLVSFRFVASLIGLTRKSDVIHISFSRELIPLLALVVGLLFRKRCIVQSHGMLTSRASTAHAVVDLFLRPLVKRAASVIALTSVEALALREWARDEHLPVTILGNPVPSKLAKAVRHRPASRDAVFIARLHQRKRVDVFLAAAEHANGRKDSPHFVVVGPDGGCLSDVRAASSKLSNVTYEGAITSEEVTARVSEAGVFVLTSENEPWGNVLAIALASGVPVIVPRSAALASAISDFSAGVVVDDGSPDQVETAILSLMSNSKLYSAASAGALQLASSLLSPAQQRLVLGGIYS